MKLIVSPCSQSFREVGCITEPNKIAYAAKYGWETWFPEINVSDGRGFDRVRLMIEALDKAETVLFTGADTIFTNFDHDVSEFTSDAAIDIVWDCHGLQSDVMFLHRSDELISLLKEVYEKRNTPPRGKSSMADSDQAALVTTLSGRTYFKNMPVEYLQARIKVNSMDPTMNQYAQDWSPGNMVFHTPGMPINQKVSLLQGMLSQLSGIGPAQSTPEPPAS